MIIIGVSFVLMACSKKQKKTKEEHVYDVISVLYKNVSRKKMIFFAFPPSPPPSNIRWDSLKKIMELDREVEKDTIKKINKLLKRKGRLIVAIDSVLYVPHLDNIKQLKYEGYEKLLNNFVSIDTIRNIDVTKITSNKYAFCIPYLDDYKFLQRKGYEKFNIRLKFSEIAFNEKFDKAIVIMGASFGRLNGFSSLFLLEKTEGRWCVKYEKGLSIS